MQDECGLIEETRSLDGGYYLLGLNGLTPKIFQQIPWGTDQVLAATRERARELDLKLHELRTLHDIDRPADLVHLPAAFLEAHPELAQLADEVRTS